MNNLKTSPINRNEWLVVAIIFAVSLALYSTQWFNTFRIHPSTVAAERILAGQIPYRDFWTIYAPGSFYLLAFLFKLFGTHLLVEYIGSSLLCAAAVCIYYRLILNLVDKRALALACTAICLAATYSTRYYLGLGPYPPTLLLVLVGYYFTTRHFMQRSLAGLACAGFAIGLAVLIKHDVAVYSGVAISVGIVIHHIVNPLTLKNRIYSIVIELAIFIAAAAVIAIPVLAYFASLAGMDMWQDLIVFPGTMFSFARPESYPTLLPIGIYDPWRMQILFNIFRYIQFNLPLVVVLSSLFAMGFALGKQNAKYLAPSSIFVVAFLFHYSSAHVQINTNIISISVYAVSLGVLSYRLIDQELVAAGRICIMVLGLAVMAGWITALSVKSFYDWQISSKETKIESGLPKISGIKVAPNLHKNLAKLREFVNELAAPGQKVFLGLHRHDVTVTGDPKIYFILDRLNPTRHDQLHPGIVDRADIQAEMIRDLQTSKTSVIILDHIFSDQVLNAAKARRAANLSESGAQVLDDFIHSNYTKIRTIGPYDVMQRRSITRSISHQNDNP